MSLIYPGKWKFESNGAKIPGEAVSEMYSLILKIANGSQNIIELFKTAFGNDSTSSSYSWAVSDLSSAIDNSKNNAPVFIDSLWNGIEWSKKEGFDVPDVEHINKLMSKFNIPYKIQPPDLISIEADSVIIENNENSGDFDNNPAYNTYTLHNELGKGGYGIVYRATRKTKVTEFEYALKVLDPSPFVNDYDKAIKRFQREVEILKTLQHRAIVPYYDAGISIDGKPYIVMPLIDGRNIYEDCKTRSLHFVINCFISILEALEYAHNMEVIHRDLKPSNIIMRSSDNQPIILDFGSAYTLDQMDSKSLTTQAVGTIGYIPSEVLMNPKKRTMLQDIFACGVLFYEIFAGIKPDPNNYLPLSNIRPEYKQLDTIIRHAIEGETKRTPNAKVFIEELTGLRP